MKLTLSARSRVMRAASVVALAMLLGYTYTAAVPLSAGSALAAIAPSLTLKSTSLRPGTATTATGTAFPVSTTVTFTLDGSSAGMPVTRTKANGTFSISITVPLGAVPGTHTLAAFAGGVSASTTLVVTTATTAPATATAVPTTTAPPPTVVATPVTAIATATATIPSSGTGTLTTLLSDNFESGSTSAWTGTNMSGTTSSVNVTTAAANSGAYGLDTAKLGTNDNGHAEVYKTLTAPAANVLSLRSEVRIVSQSGAGGLYLQRLYRSAPVYQPIVSLHYSGTTYALRVRRLDGSLQDTPLMTQPTTGTWYDVELVYDWNGAQPIATAYMNGLIVATITDSTVGSVYAPDSAYVGLYEDNWTRQTEAQWDTVSVANGVQSVAATSSALNTASATPVPTSTPISIASPTATATPVTLVATATSVPPTPTATTVLAAPTSVPSSTGTTPSGPLSVGSLIPASSSVAEYDKILLTVPITGSLATNLQFPYDPVGAPGLAPATGVTVDGEFLPAGQSDWSKAIVQPGFLYQDYSRQQINGKQWEYPQGAPVWQVRFAPQQQGTWQVRVRAQDASICSSGVNPCTNWVRSAAQSFTVTAPRAGNHGFVEVDPNDTRYFQFSDGTAFIGQGYDDSLGGDTYQTDARLATDAQNGVTFIRSWMDGQDIAGSSWSPWWAFNGAGYGGYLPEPGLQNAPSGSGHDFVFQLTPSQPCILNGFTQGNISVKPSTTYRLTTTVSVSGLAPANAALPSGFAVKTGLWPSGNNCPGGVSPSATPIPETGNTNGFTTLTGTLTTSASQNFLDDLYLMLNNASAGQALVTSVSLQEVLPGGSLGPNLIAKGNSDMHEDFNQSASWAWDHIIDTAAADNVYLKLVTLEKNDRVWNRINPDGTLSTNDTNNNNFYAGPGTKVRMLQEYYWRYLAARWGYATSVHSWEYVNEGDPANGNHFAATDAFAAYTHQADPSRHMVTTSTWASFPVDTFWGNPQYPNIDYADVHAYVSTGFGSSYAWDAPSGTTLDTNTSDTYQHSAGALEINANTVSSPRSVPIRGQGTWTVSALIKANNLQGACPYGAPASMAGPQLDITLSNNGPHVIAPQDSSTPNNYWICTAPAGTYDYRPIQATFSLADTNWYTLSLRFQTKYATSGSAWFDNLVVTAPDGRTVDVFGNGNFDDHQRFDYDDGLFNSAFGLLDGARSLSGANKPVVRGETGIDPPGGPQTELAQLANDTHGVWLHNYLWGSLNAGGMYDLYWWNTNIFNNNLFFQYKPIHDFLAAIPSLNNGLYQDAQPIVSNTATVGAMGQKDLVNGHAYVWIRNLNHTWFNGVNNTPYGRLSGTVAISGLSPNAAYSVNNWLFDDPGRLSRADATLQTDGFGVLTLNLDSLGSNITDLGVLVAPAGNVAPSPVPPTATPVASPTPVTLPTGPVAIATPIAPIPGATIVPTPTEVPNAPVVTPTSVIDPSVPSLPATLVEATRTPVAVTVTAGGGGGGGGGGTAPGGSVGSIAYPMSGAAPAPQAQPLSTAASSGVLPTAQLAPAAPSNGTGQSVILASGGQATVSGTTVNFPADKARPTLAYDALALDPLSLPPAPAGTSMGQEALQITTRDAASGDPVTTFHTPLTVGYTPSAGDLAAAQGNASNVRLAEWTGSAWAPLPCATDATSGSQSCTVSELATFTVLVASPTDGPQDWALPNGHFYKQANGFSGAAQLGFSVVDDSDAGFWTAFQAYGGVDGVGYPISQRFMHQGFLTQAFQKMALQWRPDLGQAAPVNAFDDLSNGGADGWLDQSREVPPSVVQADAGSTFEDVFAARLGMLDAYSALQQFYLNSDNALTDFGLPVSIKDYGTFVAVRLQRATLQLWKQDTPWAAAGTVVVGNGSDIAKEAGLWPAAALAPTTSPAG